MSKTDSMSQPLVSVILPVYNGEKHLAEAIDSLLAQTYTNLEINVIIDGSKDNCLSIAQSYQDERVKVYENEVNLGLIGTLNRGLSLCKGEYIARMDQDDISLSHRFQKQVEFLQKHPKSVLCGSNYTTFGEKAETTYFATSPEEIKIQLHFFSCIGHPTVMFNAKVLFEFGINYQDFKDTEDWATWYALSKAGAEFRNLDDVLLKYRLEGQSTTVQDFETRKMQYKKHYKIILSDLNIEPNERNLDLHWALSMGHIGRFKDDEIINFTKKVAQALKEEGYKKEKVDYFLGERLKRMFFVFADRSRKDGFKFMLKEKDITLKKLIYLLKS